MCVYVRVCVCVCVQRCVHVNLLRACGTDISAADEIPQYSTPGPLSALCRVWGVASLSTAHTTERYTFVI